MRTCANQLKEQPSKSKSAVEIGRGGRMREFFKDSMHRGPRKVSNKKDPEQLAQPNSHTGTRGLA